MPSVTKRLLTLEDLVQFCASNNFDKFSSAESGYKLSVQVPATATFTFDNKNEEIKDSLLFVTVKMFHTGINRNGSSISEEAAKKSLAGIKYKPILANFCEIDGVRDFTSHDRNITKDDDGNTIIEYIEKQVGCFTAKEPYMEYDENEQKTFIFAEGAIPREYTDAADIIERKDGTKVSVELMINEMSYSAVDKVLMLDDFEVMGCTLLGKHADGSDVEEGMKGARLDIEDFSTKKNAVTPDLGQMVSVLEKLNNTLSSLNLNSEKGDNTLNKFDELLAQYNVTADDVAFDYEGLSDEELEAAFAEAFAKSEEDEQEEADGQEDDAADEAVEDGNAQEAEFDGDDDGSESDEGDDGDEGADDEEDIENDITLTPGKKNYTLVINGKTFEISLEDKIEAVWNIINETYGESEGTYYGCDVFDDYVIMHDYWNSRKIYKQSYSMEDGVVKLEGEREEVFCEYLTASEKDALALMRSTYEGLKEYKETTEKALLNAQKDEVFAQFDEKLKDNPSYKKLVEDRDNYSVEDISLRCNALIGEQTMQFEAKNAQGISKKKTSVGFDFTHKPEKKPYGNLFD